MPSTIRLLPARINATQIRTVVRHSKPDETPFPVVGAHTAVEMSPPTDAPRQWVALATVVGLEVALVLSWSAGFVGIRFAIDYAPIFLILLWRSLVSGLVLLHSQYWRGRVCSAKMCCTR